MAKRLKALAEGAGGSELAGTIRDSAQQIWLAGLGAFAKTQAEGAKVFEALVKEGKALEGRTRKIAKGTLSQMTNRWSQATNGATAKATATWDKLEQVFEDRVARALAKLGVPTAREVQSLAKRVDELAARVRRQAGNRAPRGGARKGGVKRARAR
jgi:poly(hydroxyalkanoate) granule-associated protein